MILDGVIIAGLVRTERKDEVEWTAELLVDLPPRERPLPFQEAEHRFKTFEEACRWLGLAGG